MHLPQPWAPASEKQSAAWQKYGSGWQALEPPSHTCTTSLSPDG